MTLFPKIECRWHGLVITPIAKIIPHTVPEMSVFSQKQPPVVDGSQAIAHPSLNIYNNLLQNLNIVIT